MKDYSQTGEQAAILEALGLFVSREGRSIDVRTLDYRPGRLIDIGAWHAEQFSNTRALYELGWSGIFIEPSPGPLKGLVQEYGMSDQAIVIGAAVTPNGGLVELQVTDDAVSCSPDSAGAKIWDKDGGFYGKLLVPSLSVADLFQRFGGDFQMVSIDVEGGSVDLFVEMLRVGPRPRCVVVEHDNRIVELAQHAEAANYRTVLTNGNNLVLQWQSGL